jgi:hypothetical protein
MSRLTRGFPLVIVLSLAGCGTQVVSTFEVVGSGLPFSSAKPTVSVEGCVPECLPKGGTQPGPLPAGLYTAQYFFGGALTITLDAGWVGLDDTQNELIFEHPAPPDWLVFVWVDPYPVEHLARVAGVDRTPEALVASLQSNPTLIATPGPMVLVADGIPAVTVDLTVSDAATKEDPECPDICTNYLGFENGPPAHGLVRGAKTRIYFAPVTYGGQTHLLTLSVEVIDSTQFDALLPTAEELLRTIRMPVAPA